MRKIIIVGNPNVGKSTLFNSLTKSNEHTGNFHGVTVKEKSKTIVINSQQFQIIDLPGMYSLNSYSYEEEVAKNYLLKNKDEEILMLTDANSLKRNLYLCLQLSELKIKYKLLINNYDYFKNKGNILNLNKLKKYFSNAEIINAKKEKNLKNVLNSLNFDLNLPYLNDFLNTIKNKFKNMPENTIIKAINGIYENLNNEQINYIKSFNKELIQARYNFIDEIIKSSVEINKNYVYGFNKCDKFLLNPFISIVGFLTLFFVSIYLIFFGIGNYLSNFLILCYNKFIVQTFMNLLYVVTDNVWLLQFFKQGVLSSISTVLTFLPQVALLFMFLTILEDSGIISRLCYVFDDLFSKFGLTGKAVYIMLLGLGCNTMSTYATRNISGKSMKIKTAILNPYISCLARLPILVIVATAFFKTKAYFVVAGLYCLGIIALLTMSLILNKTLLTSKDSNLLLEFPPLRGIDFKHILKQGYINAKDMLKRILSVVLCVGSIVYVVSHTKLNFDYTQNFSNSVLHFLSSKISFVFKPIGLNSAGVVAGLIVGIMAKELIVSCFSVTNGVNSTKALISSIAVPTSVVCFTLPSSVSFLVFVLLYCPCASNIAVLKKEVGGFWATFSVISQISTAYLISFVVYTILTKGVMFAILVLIIILILMASIIFIIKKVKQGKCLTCGKCLN